MFDLTDKIPDKIKDDVLLLLKALNNRVHWNDEAKVKLAKLIKFLQKKKYLSFIGHPSRYHLTRIGDSCLYDVPPYRKGVLKEFRGKRIRIICVSSGRFDRHLMAGVVGVTPSNKLKVKEKIVFVFPVIGDHEIVYLGRRFMVINSKGEYPIELHQGSSEFIDPSSCDLILLDGKECCPIATMKYLATGELVGNLIGRKWDESFLSIRDAIVELAKKHERFKSRYVNL